MKWEGSIAAISKRSQRLVLGALLFAAVFSLLVFGAWRYSTFRISKNFHEVDPGRFYRSAQLTPEELDEVVKKYGIKTVISLRGAPEHTPWYQPEVDKLKELGVDFQAVWWTAEFFPPKEELVRYEELLDKPQYPILVHCRVGSDRTGAATAIYAMQNLHQTNEQAVKDHLNFDYWHVEAFKPAMAELVRRYKGPDWVKNVYDPCSLENRPWAEAHQCQDRPAASPASSSSANSGAE